METLSTEKSFGGVQGVYRHASGVTGCDMTFAVYLPPQAEDGPVPVLWYLSGLPTPSNASLILLSLGCSCIGGKPLILVVASVNVFSILGLKVVRPSGALILSLFLKVMVLSV